MDGRAAVDALMGFPYGRVLAGPPAAVTKLEGANVKRKQSVVGRIAPTPPSGVHRKRGLVAEEVVVKRTDATLMPIAPPAKPTTLVPLGDLGEDDEHETGAYSAETAAELRAAIRSGEGEPGADSEGERAEPSEEDALDAKPREAEGDETRDDAGDTGGAEASSREKAAGVEAPRGAESAAEAKAAGSRDAGAQPREARARDAESAAAANQARSRDAESAAAANQARSRDAESAAAANQARSRDAEDRKGRPEPARTGRAGETIGREGRTEAKESAAPSEHAASGTTSPATPEPVASPEPKQGSSGAWLAAGIVLALGVGGWAAWRLQGEDEPTASSTRRVSPASAARAGEARGADESQPGTGAETPTAGENPVARIEAGGDESGDPAPNAAEDRAAEIEASPDVNGDEHATAETVANAAQPADAAEQRGAEAGAPGQPPEAAEQSAESALVAAHGQSAPALVGGALEAARQHDYSRSEALSRQALAVSPRNPRAGYRLATALFHQERYREAIETAREVAGWAPRDPLPRALLGDIYSRRGQFHQAAREYQRALDANPSFASASRSLERLRGRGITP